MPSRFGRNDVRGEVALPSMPIESSFEVLYGCGMNTKNRPRRQLFDELMSGLQDMSDERQGKIRLKTMSVKLMTPSAVPLSQDRRPARARNSRRRT